MTFRRVTDDFWVSAQVTPEAVKTAAELGVRAILNNRPEGEEYGQPTGDEIAAAAREAGLAYAAVPVRGRPTAADLEMISALIEETDGPVLAYCKSGLRSILAWAAAEAVSGRRSRDEVVALALGAGYDLDPYL